MKSHGGPPRPPRRPGQDPWGDGDDESSEEKYKFIDVVRDLTVSISIVGLVLLIPFRIVGSSDAFLWVSNTRDEAISWLAYRPIP